MKRFKVHEHDWQRISTELGKYSYPLKTVSDVLYNITMYKWLQRWSMCQTPWHVVEQWQLHTAIHPQPDSMQSSVRQ
jgi:hypothetical protein